MTKIKLFEDISPKKIIAGFKTVPDTSDFKSSLKGKILQLKDISNPERHVIINFDLEGRLIDIELGTESLNSNIKILERSFDGKFYVYSENCKNLKTDQKSIYYYYDYYNEVVYGDLEMSKFLMDSVSSLLKEISKFGYASTDKMILIERESVKNNISLSQKVKNISPLLVKILEYAYKIYDWEGLLKEKFLLQKIYSTPINILPPEVRPDQNPVFAVIQMTQGCWIKDLRGPCKFCNSYKNISCREKGIEELKEHIRQVRKFTGRGWRYVKKIFLSDADPFHTKIDSEIYLKFLLQEIPHVNWYESFISTPTILLKSESKWRKLMKLGLKRLYWGVESADDKTLKILDKAHNKKMLYKAASILNKMDIPYVIILLSGIGDLNSNRKKKNLVTNSHIKETAKFARDIDCPNVYISRFIPQPGTKIYNLIKENKLYFPSWPEREIEHRTMIKMICYNEENPLIPARNVKGTYGAQFNR